jgi:hypothetical protein
VRRYPILNVPVWFWLPTAKSTLQEVARTHEELAAIGLKISGD